RAHAEEAKAGIKSGTVATGTRHGVEAYIPHYTKRSIEDRAPSEVGAGASAGKRTIKLSSQKGRKSGTLAEKEAENPGKYNQDQALAYVNRIASSRTAVAQAEMNKRLMGLGRPYKPGAE